MDEEGFYHRPDRIGGGWVFGRLTLGVLPPECGTTGGTWSLYRCLVHRATWLFAAVGSGLPSVARASGGSQADRASQDNQRHSSPSRSSLAWVMMISDSAYSCLSASTVTTGSGRPSATSAGQAWIGVQPRFSGSSAWVSLLSLMVVEHNFDQTVSVPHPDDELASHSTSGNLGVRMPGWTLPAVSGLGGCRRPPA